MKEARLFVTVNLFDNALHLTQQRRKLTPLRDDRGRVAPVLERARLLPFDAPGDLPLCIRQRPFVIEGD
jgi:hypothetical protein